MFEFLEHLFNQRALLAVLVIGFSNGALGTLVVLKKNALFVSALAHALLPGIALALLIFGVLSPWIGLVGALFGALLVGLSSIWVARLGRLDDQSSLTVLYTTFFAAGLLILERVPTFTHLESWLFGNLLGLRAMDLRMSFAVASLIILLMLLFRRAWILWLFDPSVAAAMGLRVRWLGMLYMLMVVLGLVTSLQAVGTVLSAAMFIMPPAILMQWMQSPRALIWGSGLLGGGSGILAIAISNWLDVRSGACLILVLGLFFVLSLLLKQLLGQRSPKIRRLAS